MLVLIWCCYLYLNLPGFSPSSSWPEAPNAVCPLPSPQLFPADFSLPISFFQFQEILLRQCPLLTAFSNWTTLFFQFTRDNLPAKFCHDNLLVTHDPRIMATSFLVKLNLKIKTKETVGPLLSLDESNYPVVTLFVDLCYPDSSSMQDGRHIWTFIEHRSL